MKTLQPQTFSRKDVSRYGTSSQLADVQLSVIDSLITLSPRDTFTQVRYFRASTAIQRSFQAEEVQTLADTTATATGHAPTDPSTAEKKKKGVSVAMRHVRMALCLFFLIFFAVVLLCVKNNLFLQRK